MQSLLRYILSLKLHSLIGLVDESQNIVLSMPYESFWVKKVLCKRIFLRNHYCGGKMAYKNGQKIEKMRFSLKQEGIGKRYRI